MVEKSEMKTFPLATFDPNTTVPHNHSGKQSDDSQDGHNINRHQNSTAVSEEDVGRGASDSRYHSGFDVDKDVTRSSTALSGGATPSEVGDVILWTDVAWILIPMIVLASILVGSCMLVGYLQRRKKRKDEEENGDLLETGSSPNNNLSAKGSPSAPSGPRRYRRKRRSPQCGGESHSCCADRSRTPSERHPSSSRSVLLSESSQDSAGGLGSGFRLQMLFSESSPVRS